MPITFAPLNCGLASAFDAATICCSLGELLRLGAAVWAVERFSAARRHRQGSRIFFILSGVEMGWENIKKVAVPKHRHLFETDGLPEFDVEQDDAAHNNQA